MPSCSGRGGVLAAVELLEIKGAVDDDWRELECIRGDGMARWCEHRLLGGACARLLEGVNAIVVLGDACRWLQDTSPNIISDDGLEGTSSTAKGIVEAFLCSQARVLLLCSINLLHTAEWNIPLVHTGASLAVETAELWATAVAVPLNSRRVFVGRQGAGHAQ